MAKKRSISISLAAKCQLLFGLAVLVIIAGALAVPWQRMEQLAVQPNVKAARLAADLYFRQIHANALANAAVTLSATNPAPAAGSGGGAGAGGASTAPADTWNDIALTDSDFPPPQIYTAPSATQPFSDSDGGSDPVASQALALFREKPQETDFGKVYTVTNRASERIREYRYAAPIRLDASCLHCHTEYLAWVRGTPATAAGVGNPLASATLPSLRSTSVPAAWPVVGVVRVDVPYQTDENQLLLNRIVIVVAGMLGGTLAIVVFYLITSRLILQPVRVLKNTAEKVSKGDLNIRSAISTGDEFQHLSETFNTMLANLKASQDQLEATNRSLDTRVGELAQSNVDLFEANRLKSEFLTNVTHELRTPLNAILGFADLMGDAAARAAAAGGGVGSVAIGVANSPEAKLQRYSENIRTSARQLLELINDLLDLAKIEAGKIVLREEKVNVADVCEAMANFMRPLAQKKNIDLHVQIAPDMPLITTDAGRFQQILYNFLSNAIKFTPAEGAVTIAARREEPVGAGAEMEIGGGAVRVSITDTGPGISPEDQKVIFDKFRQIDGSVTRQHAGTGLGLTIARELASMLGARIELASAMGKGATFTLVMPVENPNTQQPARSGAGEGHGVSTG